MRVFCTYFAGILAGDESRLIFGARQKRLKKVFYLPWPMWLRIMYGVCARVSFVCGCLSCGESCLPPSLRGGVPERETGRSLGLASPADRAFCPPSLCRRQLLVVSLQFDITVFVFCEFKVVLYCFGPPSVKT